MALIKQSWVTGKVKGIPYQGLLSVELTTQRLIFSLMLGGEILDIPINSIQNVKQIRNIFSFGLKINYFDGTRMRSVRFRTRKYKQWSSLFASMGISIIPHGGWFEIV